MKRERRSILSNIDYYPCIMNHSNKRFRFEIIIFRGALTHFSVSEAKLFARSHKRDIAKNGFPIDQKISTKKSAVNIFVSKRSMQNDDYDL